MFFYEPLQRFDLKRCDAESGRTYITPFGEQYPSVTNVLRQMLDKSALDAWKKRVGRKRAAAIADAAARHGTTMHSLLEGHLLNEDAPLDLMPDKMIAFRFLRQVVDRHVGTVYGVELPLWSDYLRSAGTTDALLEWDGEKSVLDLKNMSSTRSKSNAEVHGHFLQATAYAMMAYERYRIKFTQAVILLANGFEEPLIMRSPIKEHVREVYDIFRRYSSCAYA